MFSCGLRRGPPIRVIILFVTAILLNACATRSLKLEVPQYLFNDDSFLKAHQTPDPQSIFKVSSEMKQFIEKDIPTQLRSTNHQKSSIQCIVC